MSDLYKADASNFTREQLVELINLQTNLHLEANKTIVVAKGKIEELEHEIERLNRFCKEFIYGEDNPKYYKTMDEKIAEKEARILELEGKLKASEKTGLYISKCALEGVAELEKLEKQNVRMKECLELTFKDINECGFIAIMELRIKQCLKELEGEE